MNTIKRQTPMCKQEFDERSRDVIVQLAEQVSTIKLLTFYALMDSSFWFDTRNLGRSIVYTVQSRKFEVFWTRGFISNYHWFEL